MRTMLLELCLLIACGSNANPHPGDPPDAATAIDGAPPSKMCGGLATAACAADEYCDYANNTCGATDETGTCKPRPGACPLLVGRDVCGCDGKVHTSECATYAVGFDLNAGGSCDKVAGKFACGYALCDLTREYCRREPHPDAAETFTCAALPVCPAAPSCGCLATERCGDACTGDAKVGLTLSCPSAPLPR